MKGGNSSAKLEDFAVFLPRFYKTEPVYVSSESTLISVAITLSGSGVAWVGDLQIEEVSEREVGEMDH